MLLSEDFCRCHDNSCKKHKTCLRWLDRKHNGLWISHAKTLRIDEEYDCYIGDKNSPK